MSNQNIRCKSRVIGLYAPAPQSGKSEASKIMEKKHGFEMLSFADPLKHMLGSLLMDMGFYTTDIRQMLYGNLKESDLVSRNLDLDPKITPRYLAQTLGTEWGRHLIDSELWVKIAKKRAETVINTSTLKVVFDDVRFPNEYKAIKDMGGLMVKITRSGVVKEHNHVSDGALDDYEFDMYLENNGTLEEYQTAVDDFVSNIIWEGSI